ncbi:MAG TPA: VOC family protein [Lacunisphaera sp.]|nr:VOC family protein [Lacunisphaera sp.]
MKIRATDFIAVPVRDLAVAARFYRDVLGLHQVMFAPEYQWAEFDAGNVTIGLHGDEQPAPPGGIRVAFAVDDVSAAAAELAALGVKLGGPPQDWGVCQSLEVVDPDGNVLLLHHRNDGTCGQGS